VALTIAVVGVGLIGGSFALAARQAGIASRVIGVSSPATVQQALAAGVIDEALPLQQAVPAADLVLLSSTIRGILDTLPLLQPLVRPETLVTDAGSTKRLIVQAARAVDGLHFVGGHPMAGKEQSGVQHADAALFQGRPWVLCPSYANDDRGIAQLHPILEAIGARPVVVPPEEHDFIVARTSHLPQLLSTALAAALEQRFHGHAPTLAGPGLLDSTRLALSPISVWRDILETNRDEVIHALTDFQEEWGIQMLRLADTADLTDQFQRANQFARRLREQPPTPD
jgi:prephenate dehydrogenase